MIFKQLNSKEKYFYVFETSTTHYSVFDSNIDVPIYTGTWLLTARVIESIKRLRKDAVISYYSVNKDGTLRYEPIWSQKQKRRF